MVDGASKAGRIARTGVVLWLVCGAGFADAGAQGLDPPPLFEEVRVRAVQPVHYGSAAWGDYDNDGDFDLFVTGSTGPFDAPVPFTQLYLHARDQEIDPDSPPGGDNVPTAIYEDGLNVSLPVLEDVWRSTAAWGDYDNDGDLDVLVAGVTASGAYSLRVYENIPGAERFVTGFTGSGVRDGAAAWGDYDNDGDLDFVLAGTGADGRAVTDLYENQVRDGGGFVRRDASLVGVHQGSVDWGDYDGDGDLDLLVTGIAEPQIFTTTIYRNDGGAFSALGANLARLLYASAVWGDYDSDGDLDVLLTGARLGPLVLEGVLTVYENTGTGFSGTRVTLTGEFENDPALGRFQGSAGWGDYNNDGAPDFFVTGLRRATDIETGQVYRNLGDHRFTKATGLFTLPARFAGGLFGSVLWGDYDGDDDLDLFVLADKPDGSTALVTLRNYLGPPGYYPPNTPPVPPTGLQGTAGAGQATFLWDPGSDAQTAPPGLTYNLRVGTTPGGLDVVSPMADPATGHVLRPAPGNVGHVTQWTLRDLAPGTYYWSVQAVDASFKGSVFAPEATITVP